MSTQFIKPENALRRAEELISIDSSSEALNVLHGVIASKKNKTWSAVIEELMKKHLTLSVELRKGKVAKEALHQYRSTYPNNLASLENVIRVYLKEADAKASQAQAKADKVVLDVEDLEAEDGTEGPVLLTSIIGEDRKDRADRELVTPWLRFLWESYRIVLDILKNNKLESLYHDTAQQALQFCLKYKRQTEFKRLSEMLRSHYSALKNQVGTGIVTFVPTTAESIQTVLDTRFAQLNTAISLELWSEAFKTIEEIHQILSSKSKPVTKPQMMAQYYLRLSQVFWVSKQYSFHAYAYNKFFNLSRVYNKSLTEEEIKQMSSILLCATLSIPLNEQDAHHGAGRLSGSAFGNVVADEAQDLYEFDVARAKKQRLASYLSFTGAHINADRAVLLEELVTKGIVGSLVNELTDLYNLVEKQFHPLTYCATLQTKLEFVSKTPALKQYESTLKNVVVLRLLDQLSQVYDKLHISEFTKLVPIMERHALEKLVVSLVANRMVDLRIDHQNGVLLFKSDNMESHQFKNKLNELALGVHKAISLITPIYKSAELIKEQQVMADRKKNLFQAVMMNLEDERNRILARRKAVEEKKIQLEEEQRIKQEQADIKRQQEEAEREKQEQIKQKAAEAERERLKKEREQQEKEKQIAQRLADTLMKKAPELVSSDSAAIQKLAEGQMNIEEFRKTKIAEREKQIADLEQKMKRTHKELDWLERARRLEERPLLKDFITSYLESDKTRYEKEKTTVTESSKVKYEAEIKEKTRLSRIIKDRTKFEASLFAKRKAEHEKLVAERAERIAAKKQQILKEQEEQRQREEDERRQEEEEEERRIAEIESRRAAEEDRQRKLREAADKQLKKQQEIEDRLKKQQQEAQQSVSNDKKGYLPPHKRGPGSSAPSGPSSTSSAPREPLSPRKEEPPAPAPQKESFMSAFKNRHKDAPAEKPAEKPMEKPVEKPVETEKAESKPEPPRTWANRPTYREERPAYSKEREDKFSSSSNSGPSSNSTSTSTPSSSASSAKPLSWAQERALRKQQQDQQVEEGGFNVVKNKKK